MFTRPRQFRGPVCAAFRNNHFFKARNCYNLPQPPKLKDHHLSAAATAYSIHSQLSSLSGGLLFHQQPEDAPCRDDSDTIHTLKDVTEYRSFEESFCLLKVEAARWYSNTSLHGVTTQTTSTRKFVSLK